MAEERKVLEIGCGIRRSGDTTIAIDKIKTPQVDIVRDVAKRGIPFCSSMFDQVLAYDVIEHIESYDDLIFLFNEIYRVLKPNGLFHFTTPNGFENSLTHITHHRGFVKSSFDYFIDGKDDTFDHMRKSDGIEATFRQTFNDDDTSVLNGIFYAVKQ